MKITRTGPIVYQKMLIDKRGTQPGLTIILGILIIMRTKRDMGQVDHA